MTTNIKVRSLLKVTKEKIGYAVNNLKKGMKKHQKKYVAMSQPLLEKNLDKTYTLQWMYVNQCLIKYSRDIDLFNDIENMNSIKFENFLKNKDNGIVNFDSFRDASDTKRNVLFPYGGGKQNHRTTQQSIISQILRDNPNHFKTYYEPFLGGFGSVYNSLPLLIENGIEDIFLSDVNPSIINIYRQVQKNHKQVQRHLASIDIEYFKTYGKYYPESKIEAKEWFMRIHEEFSEIESKKRMNPRRAALLLYLLHNTQGGMLNYSMKTKTNKLSHTFCMKKVRQVPLIINKVEVFNRIFNLGNIKFSIKRYETVNNKIKNDSTALVLFDPPYVNYEEVSTSKDFLNCSYNYGINDFNHRMLLTKINNSQYTFVYYNNHNPHLENYSIERGFNYKRKDVDYKNGSKPTKSVEVLMFKDRTNLSIQPVNSCDFRSIEIADVA